MVQRRRKKRTHVVETEAEFNSVPRSMVVHLGTALENHVLTKLVKDLRNVMQPYTTINLKERKHNKLKDFVSVASNLGISFMMILSQNESSGGVHLRMAKMSHGPTLSFRVKEYMLSKDIARSQRNPKSLSKGSVEFVTPPLLVLNGFTNPKEAEPEEKLMITMFQNMFPPIVPQTTKVNTIKRVLLINKDKQTGEIDLRHYVIDTKLVDVSKNIGKLLKIKKRSTQRIPNLSRVQDVADIILDPYAQAGFTSDSEVETDAVVEVNEEEEVNVSKKKTAVSSAEAAANMDDDTTEVVKRKRAVKLVEVGPRMKLVLEKIEEGVCDGKVMYHAYNHRSEAEVKVQDKVHAERKQKREERKRKQKENLEKKHPKKKRVSFKKKEDEEDEKEKEEGGEEKEERSEESETEVLAKPADSDSDSDKLFDE